MCYDRRVDEQQHPRHCKKKMHTSYVHACTCRRWRKNQAMISSVILDGFIMVLMRRIEEEEEVFSGCITSRREVSDGGSGGLKF